MQYFPEMLYRRTQYHHDTGERVKATYVTKNTKYQGYNKVQTVQHYVRHPVTLTSFILIPEICFESLSLFHTQEQRQNNRERDALR